MKTWHRCNVCSQKYHGTVASALVWGCWKTYLGRPESCWFRCSALGVLASGLRDSGYIQESLSAQAASLALLRRFWPDQTSNILASQGNLALCYEKLNRFDEALRVARTIYSGYVKLCGPSAEFTLVAGTNLCALLSKRGEFAEATPLAREQYRLARQRFGDNHDLTITAACRLAEALFCPGRTHANVVEAMELLDDVIKGSRIVYGPQHPYTMEAVAQVKIVRADLDLFQP